MRRVPYDQVLLMVAGISVLIMALGGMLISGLHPAVTAESQTGPQWHDAGAGLRYVDLDLSVRCYRSSDNSVSSPLSCVKLP